MPIFRFLIRSSWTDGAGGGAANHKRAGRRRKAAITYAETAYGAAHAPPNNLVVKHADFTFDEKYDFAWQVDLTGATSAACVQTLVALWAYYYNTFGNVQFNWVGGVGGVPYTPPAGGVQPEPDIRDIT
jgi:hypothetical protein